MHISGLKGKVLTFGIISVIFLSAFAAILVGKASAVMAKPGQTTACNACHAYPPTTIGITTDKTSVTVAPGATFTVGISWTGGGSYAEVNWPTSFTPIGIARDNVAFNPSPRIPYSGTSGSGSTSFVLTAPATPGTYIVRVYASRQSPWETDYQDITVTVAAANQAPVLAVIGNKTVTEGQALTFIISAIDPNGDALTYSASNLPSGATFNTSTRVFSWTPSIGQAGSYANVHFQVSDGSLTDYENITITVNAVNQAPVLAAVGNKTVTEGQTLTFTVSATDPNGDALTYSASNLPSGAAFNSSTHVFSWTPATGQAGSYANVHFQVSDGSLTDYENITITVNATNLAPVIAPIGNKTVTEGQALTFTVSATDPNGDTLTYSATNLPSGATFDTSTHVFSWTPATGQAGVYAGVQFAVTDGSLTTTQDITITVNAPAPDTAGPLMSAVAVSPNPAKGAKLITLTAGVSDLTTGGSNIAAAEYFIDTISADGTGTAMAALDGTFDEVTEAVTASLDVSGLTTGRHTIYVHGQDAAGNWGTVARVSFRIPRPPKH